MNTMLAEYELAQSLAEKYRANGYTVEIEPDSSRIPFDLNGYRPDMIAIKEDSKLIIEVKPKSQRVSVERLQAVAQLISEHQGWRFIVVTPDDVENNYFLNTQENHLTWSELSKKIAQIPLIIDAIGNAAALIYIWGLVEAALRRYVIDASIPVENFPFTRMVKHLYSIGELSIDELNLLLTSYASRNKVAHGYNTEIANDTLNQLINFINRLVAPEQMITYQIHKPLK
jgi:Holliday junction resolvase